MNRTKPRKAVRDAAELRQMTADLDQEFVVDKFAPLDAEARRQWRRAKRKRGRPVRGEGVQVISISIERGLLRASDELARRKKITRANLVARGLRAILAAEGAGVPPECADSA
jgi:hypothetical protein